GTFKGSSRIELALMTSLHPMDPLHANALEILPRDAAGLWQRGDLLLSIRELDLIVVLSPDGRRLRWSWGPGEIERQHHPSLLENGHLLIFDNGQRQGRSRVLELDARARKIVWSYVGKPPKSFFSPIRGGCQQLPNGNTLITDSERGRAFEVTRDKQLVWEFYNPDLQPFVKEQLRAPIYRMLRFAPDVLTRAGGRQRGPSKR
ncbi:arylsulfotransferase family protein, partial [archaeon]|nr:arylsulfotransferase family protein [archaeon]